MRKVILNTIAWARKHNLSISIQKAYVAPSLMSYFTKIEWNRSFNYILQRFERNSAADVVVFNGI